MGCDIHAYLEIRRFRHDDKERLNGVWINADKWSRNEFSALYPEEKERQWEIGYDDRIWTSRWYYLFAILAGVRNQWGIKPIADKKGFPLDASDEVREEYEYWDFSGHSHSWLTLKEIEEWDGWDSATQDVRDNFTKTTIERMQEKLTTSVTSDDVRMVFWFDN
jgi:hypothetical protein